MRALVFSALVASLALAGCGKSSGPTKRDPGNWKTESKLVSLDMPGITPQMREMALAQPLPSDSQCLSKEEAAKEDPITELTKGMSDCAFTQKEFGEKVNIVGSCKGPGGAAVPIKITGTSNSKRIDVELETTGPSPMGNGNVTSKIKAVSTNVGPC